MTRARRHATRRQMALIVVMALLLQACGWLSERGDTTSDDGEAISEAALLQDVWLLTRMQAIAADGTTVDMLGEAVEELTAHAEPAVALADGLEFRPIPTLDPAIVDTHGVARPGIDVVAGLIEVTDPPGEFDVGDSSTTIAVIATAADAPGHAAPGDHLRLELFALDALAGADTGLVDYVFGQSLPPADGASTPTRDPVELWAHRIAEGAFTLGAPVDGEGDLAVFAGMPLHRTGGSEAPTAGASSDTVQTVAADPLVTVSEGGGGGGGGLMPAKATGPVVGALAGGVACALVGARIGPGGAVLLGVACAFVGTWAGLGDVSKIMDRNSGDDEPPDIGPDPGSSTGDPHLRSFSGFRYDVHAAGEFTAVVSDDGDLAVQVRMSPVTRHLASNKAVAALVEGQRVTIDVERSRPVSVDGEPVELDSLEWLELADGGTVRRHGAWIGVIWPDGTTLWIKHRSSIIDYHITLADDRRGAVSGLHGTGAGERLSADGTPLADPDDVDAVRAWVESWRIADAASLFDYPEGASTATYTDLDFPPGPMTIDDLDPDQRAYAETVCSAAGLVDQDLADCILDVGATSDLQYLFSAVEHQAIHTPGLFADAGHLAAYHGDDTSATGALDTTDTAWTTVFEEGLGLERGAQLMGDDDVVIVRTTSDEGMASIQALDVTNGDLRWDLHNVRSCRGVVTDGGRALVQIEADEGLLVAVDAASGGTVSQLAGVEFTRRCSLGMSATADGLVLYPEVRSGTLVTMSTLHGIDSHDDLATVWRREFVDADDGAVRAWAETRDERIYVVGQADDHAIVHRINPSDGTSAARVDVPMSRVGTDRRNAVVALEDGFVAVLGQLAGADGHDAVVMLHDDGTTLEPVWTRRFDDVELPGTRGFNRARGTGSLLVGWGHRTVIALDATNGSIAWVHDPTQFNNNDDALAASAEAVVVGPQGEALLEAIDPVTGSATIIEAAESLGNVGTIGPIVDGRVLVTGTLRGDGASGDFVAAIELP